MKQGTQFVLPVEIGMSLDEISRIEFVFKQKNRTPSLQKPKVFMILESFQNKKCI